MSGFIKEFYYGNIEPQTRSTRANKAISKQLQILSEAEEYLTNKLDSEEKSRFLDFVNAYSVVDGESALDSFVVGFRLGAAFTHDTFVDTNAPFVDLLKEDM